jgi:chitinase
MKRSLVKKISPFLLIIAIITTVSLVVMTPQAAGKNLVVYFPNWGIYNTAHNSITVSSIPWNKVTHINHAFFEVNSSYELASTDSFADFDKSMENSEGWETDDLRGHFGEYKYYKEQYPFPDKLE